MDLLKLAAWLAVLGAMVLLASRIVGQVQGQVANVAKAASRR